jgi:Divergent InlB B-repeat domain
VLPEVDGQELVIGQRYTLKAVPESGNLFAGWEGDMESADATLSFVMSSNLVLEAKFMANPFIPARGVYNGLFHEDDAVRQASSGGFNLKLTDRGTFTASLQMGNRKLPFTGRFHLDGRATNAMHLSKTNLLTIELAMPDDGSNDPISGRLYSDEWEAQLVVDRASFHASTNPAPFAGKYTLVMPSADEDDAPRGDGFGRVSVSAAGVVTLVGSLADGTKISDSVTLSKAGAWPLYAPLYAGKGSVLSWMTFTNLAETDIAGALSWIRPILPKAKFYTNGFAVQTDVVGSSYTSPASKTNRVIEIESGIVTLSGGGLAGALTNDISIASNNKVTNLGTNKLSLTFATATGLFSGKVLNPETGKTLKLQGAVLQKQNLGAGFFLGTDGSGRVALE